MPSVPRTYRIRNESGTAGPGGSSDAVCNEYKDKARSCQGEPNKDLTAE